MIGSAPKPLRRDEEAPSSAIVLPFRLRASRTEPDAKESSAPRVELNRRLSARANDNAKSNETQISAADRPVVTYRALRSRLGQALIAALLLHLIAFTALHIQFTNDVERAANAGGTIASDGTLVIDVEVVAETRLPPAKTPTNMTAPEAITQTDTPPAEKQEEKQEEAQKAETAPENAPQLALPTEELAAPQKTETAPAAQSPNQEKPEEKPAVVKEVQKQKTIEKKKKQQPAAPSIAAAPNRAAANRNQQQKQTGANGTNQTGGNADTSSYNARVLAHLQRYRIYPDQARSAGVTGVSTVRFTIGASGNVVSVLLARGSGSGTLDQAALAMVRRASPFPSIPPSLGRGSMTFAAPVRFNLR
jgi:protein TonB